MSGLQPRHQYLYLYLIEYYSKYHSIFRLRSVRPFTFIQQVAILELLETQGILNHGFDLETTVKLTQGLKPSTLTLEQRAQLVDWRQKEGTVLEMKPCPDNSVCSKSVTALKKIGLYDAQLPPVREYDYTLVLGGSIQEMQLRMISLLTIQQLHKNNRVFDSGDVMALTCDRAIDPEEYEEKPGMTFLTIIKTEGNPKVKVGDGIYEPLTETSAYKGIHYSLSQFCNDPDFFALYQETSEGYHPSLPTGFIPDNGLENLLYEHTENGFRFNERFQQAACEYITKYPLPHFYETKQVISGTLSIRRPTTKETVKSWLSSISEPSCAGAESCEFMAISSAPHTMYQHVALLQGLEESIPNPMKLTYQLTTGGAGASTNIPIAYPLDDLTKLLYLEERHPPR